MFKKIDIREILGSPSDTFYNTIDPRRRQEIKDSRMIQEDHRAVANLPEREINNQFNQNYFKYNQNSAGSPNFEHSEVFDHGFKSIIEHKD